VTLVAATAAGLDLSGLEQSDIALKGKTALTSFVRLATRTAA
jgi:hypothetical protein